MRLEHLRKVEAEEWLTVYVFVFGFLLFLLMIMIRVSPFFVRSVFVMLQGS